MPEVVDLKTKRKRQPSSKVLVSIDKVSGASRYYNRMLKDIEHDLGGKRLLSRIEHELIRGFCGCATRLEYLNHQILLGDAAEVDLASFSQLASTMLRIGSKLGLRRRAKDVTPTLGEIIRQSQADERERAHRQQAEVMNDA